MTAPTRDAVAQAREAALAFWVEGGLSGMEKRVDALIAAVRAECAAKVRELPVKYDDAPEAWLAREAVLRALEAQP